MKNYFKGSLSLLIASALCLSANVIGAETSLKSIYTSIKPGSCTTPTGKVGKFYNSRGDAQICPGVKSWRVIVQSSDPRDWIEIEKNKSSSWSLADEVVLGPEFRFGTFQGLSGDKVEWRVSQSGQPQALIFRVSAQDEENATKPEEIKQVSKLFVVALSGDSPKLCGVAKTNEEARALADKPEACAHELKRYDIK